LRNPDHRELFLSGLRLAAGEESWVHNTDHMDHLGLRRIHMVPSTRSDASFADFRGMPGTRPGMTSAVMTGTSQDEPGHDGLFEPCVYV
jgi:hypothetical protein